MYETDHEIPYGSDGAVRKIAVVLSKALQAISLPMSTCALP